MFFDVPVFEGFVSVRVSQICGFAALVCLVGWLAGWLAGWLLLVCWLVVWLVVGGWFVVDTLSTRSAQTCDSEVSSGAQQFHIKGWHAPPTIDGIMLYSLTYAVAGLLASLTARACVPPGVPRRGHQVPHCARHYVSACRSCGLSVSRFLCLHLGIGIGLFVSVSIFAFHCLVA